MTVLDYEMAEPGTPLGSLCVPALNRVNLAQYAAALDDYNPLHLDDKVAMAAGKTSVFAPGSLVMGHIGRLLEAALAGAAIRRYQLRMLRVLWPGDVITCRGVVVEKRRLEGEYLVDADVWADNQRSETVAKGRVLVAVQKSATAALSKKSAACGLVYPLGA